MKTIRELKNIALFITTDPECCISGTLPPKEALFDRVQKSLLQLLTYTYIENETWKLIDGLLLGYNILFGF